jgi:hypothetical protein
MTELHPVNATLPPSYVGVVQAESEAKLAELKAVLNGFSFGDNYKNLVRVCRQLQTYLDLQYRLSQNDKKELLTKMWALEFPEGGFAAQPPHLQLPIQARTRLLSTISLTLRYILAEVEPPVYGEFYLPWRPLYEALVTAHERTDFPDSCRGVESSHLRALSDLCGKARHLFAPTAAAELWVEVRSHRFFFAAPLFSSMQSQLQGTIRHV